MKRLFSGERVQAQGEVLGYREGDNDLESAPVGDFNPDEVENYGDDDAINDEAEIALNAEKHRAVQDDDALKFLDNVIVCILGRKCDHTGKASTMPSNCRNKDLMIAAIGRVCNNHQAGLQFEYTYYMSVMTMKVNATTICRH